MIYLWEVFKICHFHVKYLSLKIVENRCSSIYQSNQWRLSIYKFAANQRNNWCYCSCCCYNRGETLRNVGVKNICEKLHFQPQNFASPSHHHNEKQGSISPKFYKQLFRTKMFFKVSTWLWFGFVIFWQKEFGAKAAHKMLVKLTKGIPSHVELRVWPSLTKH